MDSYYFYTRFDQLDGFIFIAIGFNHFTFTLITCLLRGKRGAGAVQSV
jgi:hypothetical protein